MEIALAQPLQEHTGKGSLPAAPTSLPSLETALNCYLEVCTTPRLPAPLLPNQRQMLLNRTGIPQAAVVTANAYFVMELITFRLP